MKDLSVDSQNSAFFTASTSLSEIVKGGKKKSYWKYLVLPSLNFAGLNCWSHCN